MIILFAPIWPTRSMNGRARLRPPSVLEHRIETLRGLARNPVLLARLGKRECLLRGAQDLLQGADRVRKVRPPGDALRPEGVDDPAEERVGRALAPALRAHVDGRHLQVDLRVPGERK